MDAKQQVELESAVSRYRHHGITIIAGDLTKSPYFREITGQLDAAAMASDERALAQAFLAYLAVPSEKPLTFE